MSDRPVDREDIALLARHSDWPAADVKATLVREVYADAREWQQFLRYLLLGAGAAFLLSGIVFFFAYNWEALPGPVKIATVGGLFLLSALIGTFAPVGRRVRDVASTAAVALIGVLFAVLGQVYQTGADNYEYFLSWTLFALPWLTVVHFAPLWLIFVALLNTTLFTYANQVGILENYVITGLLIFLLNAGCWGAIRLLWGRRSSFSWLLKVIALWIAAVVTFNLSAGRFGGSTIQMSLTIVLSLALYALWVTLAFRDRVVYYLALVGTSVLITGVYLLLRQVGDLTAIVFLAGLIVLGGMSALATYLNRLSKQWYDR